VFVDAAESLVTRAIPAPLPKEAAFAFLKAQQILLGYGITATADMGTSLDDWLTYRRAGDAGSLRVRIISYGRGVEDTVRIGGTGPTPWLYGDRLRLVGAKIYADGALGSRGAWLKAPYADAPGQTGAGFNSDAMLRNLMSRAAMDNYQVAVHAIGDRANAQVLAAIAVCSQISSSAAQLQRKAAAAFPSSSADLQSEDPANAMIRPLPRRQFQSSR